MKIDFTKELILLDGKPIQDSIDGPTLTLKEAALKSLDYLDPQSRISAEKKYLRYKLQARLQKEEAPDLKAEEVSAIKEAVGEYPWFPQVHGILCDLLDQKESEEKKA